MNIFNAIAIVLIFLTGAYFLLLGLAALFRPIFAARFLLGFANNAAVHYLELFLRLAIGYALVHHSSTMRFASIVELFGWILIGTTACLFLLPWRWHRDFARKVVPYANRYLKLIGIVSLMLGVAIWLLMAI
jgi:uncharacterized protein YjeT (DUF2065 family)